MGEMRIEEARRILENKAGVQQRTGDLGLKAIADAQIDIQKVITTYTELFKSQQPNGMLSFHAEDVMLPPTHGFVLWKIYEDHSDNAVFVDFLKNLYPQLIQVHNYFYQHRNPLENGLIAIGDPKESGMNYSPLWKKTDKRSQVVCPLFNSILSWSSECLIEMGYALELDSKDLFNQNELTIHAMNDVLWDEDAGLYHAYDVANDLLLENHSASGFMPMIAGIPDIDQVLTMVKRAFGSDFRQEGHYSIPTYSLNKPDIQFSKPWQGSISPFMNWLLIQGLQRYEMDDLVEVVLEDSLALIDQFGFFEHFDPRRTEENNGLSSSSNPLAAALYLDLLYPN